MPVDTAFCNLLEIDDVVADQSISIGTVNSVPNNARTEDHFSLIAALVALGSSPTATSYDSFAICFLISSLNCCDSTLGRTFTAIRKSLTAISHPSFMAIELH